MSAVQEAAGDYIASEVDFQSRLRKMQLWNYAIACGLPTVPSPAPAPAEPAPSPSAPPSPAPTTPPAASGLSGLAKAGIAAAAIIGTGGLAGGLGAALTALLSRPPAVSTPPVPNGEVTIGISETGELYNPADTK